MDLSIEGIEAAITEGTEREGQDAQDMIPMWPFRKWQLAARDRPASIVGTTGAAPGARLRKA